MTTFRVGGGAAIVAATSRQLSTSFAVAGGAAVVMATLLSKVGNDARRGTNWLPPPAQPIGSASVRMPDGSMQTVSVTIDHQYFLFLDELAQRRMGGVNGPTITDVSTNASAAIVAVAATTQAVSAVAQQVDAATSAAEATKQILVDSDVPGATQIPNVERQFKTGFLEAP